MYPLILVMTGGAIGAAARYEAGRAALRLIGPNYPWGTLIVNIVGGFLMGLLAGWILREGIDESEQLRLFAGVGILGGFTTFSAFSLENWAMIERGQYAMAGGYIAASVVGSIAALAIGATLARSFA